MQQNNRLTDERLVHIYQSLKRWADHDAVLNSYISGQKIDPIFHDCVIALAELLDHRKSSKPEPVSFDALNAAVAEVTGGNQHAWNGNIYKGHQEVPFINYNSLSRIVEKFRTTTQSAPVVPELKVDWQENEFSSGWNSCCAAMLLYSSQNGWVKGHFTYDTLFNAIGKAVNIEGKALSISVNAFEEAMVSATQQLQAKPANDRGLNHVSDK